MLRAVTQCASDLIYFVTCFYGNTLTQGTVHILGDHRRKVTSRNTIFDYRGGGGDRWHDDRSKMSFLKISSLYTFKAHPLLSLIAVVFIVHYTCIFIVNWKYLI